MLQPTVSCFVKSVEYKSLTVLPSDFRKALEHENGELSDENRRKVLGKDGARLIDSIVEAPIRLPVKQ